jgi:hypothetical protein
MDNAMVWLLQALQTTVFLLLAVAVGMEQEISGSMMCGLLIRIK